MERGEKSGKYVSHTSRHEHSLVLSSSTLLMRFCELTQWILLQNIRKEKDEYFPLGSFGFVKIE